MKCPLVQLYSNYLEPSDNEASHILFKLKKNFFKTKIFYKGLGNQWKKWCVPSDSGNEVFDASCVSTNKVEYKLESLDKYLNNDLSDYNYYCKSIIKKMYNPDTKYSTRKEIEKEYESCRYTKNLIGGVNLDPSNAPWIRTNTKTNTLDFEMFGIKIRHWKSYLDSAGNKFLSTSDPIFYNILCKQIN